MNNEQIKEELNTQRNIQSHLWTATMITISGTLTLITSLGNIYMKALFIVGSLMFFALLNFYCNRGEIINNLIKKLEDNNNGQ